MLKTFQAFPWLPKSQQYEYEYLFERLCEWNKARFWAKWGALVGAKIKRPEVGRHRNKERPARKNKQ